MFLAVAAGNEGDKQHGVISRSTLLSQCVHNLKQNKSPYLFLLLASSPQTIPASEPTAAKLLRNIYHSALTCSSLPGLIITFH